MDGLCDLICACDDSNHGGDGDEIILATFSLDNNDGKYREFKNRSFCRYWEKRRLQNDVRDWMKDDKRDYRFATVGKRFSVNGSNIPWVVPALLRDYLDSYSYDVGNIRLYIDGRLGKSDKVGILNDFLDFPDMKIYSIIKRRNVVKVGNVVKKKRRRVLTFPKVLWAADILVNAIYRGDESGVSVDERLVRVVD